jgi:hypothetical protein
MWWIELYECITLVNLEIPPPCRNLQGCVHNQLATLHEPFTRLSKGSCVFLQAGNCVQSPLHTIHIHCVGVLRNFRKPVRSVMVPDLEGHQYWHRGSCWISHTACSEVRTSPSGNYPSTLVSYIARFILLLKRLRLHPNEIKAVHELKLGDSAKRVANGF